MNNRKTVWVLVGLFVGVLLAAFASSVLFGAVFMWVWNGLIAANSDLPTIGFWLACGTWFIVSSLVSLVRVSTTYNN